MIVRPKGELIEWLFRHRRSITHICKVVGLQRVHVLEHLERRGLYVRRVLKSPEQRQALARLRYAAGNRALGSAYLPGERKPAKRKERHKPRTVMTVWRGFDRSTEVVVRVRDCGGGAGLIDCIECGGTGDWTPYHPEPHLFPDGLQCVECKGTGEVFVSI